MKVPLSILSPLLLVILLHLVILPQASVILLKSYTSWCFVAVVVCSTFLSNSIWLKSQRLRWKLKRQGVKGPHPSLLYGNVPEMQRIQSSTKSISSSSNDFIAHDYTSTLFPYFEHWRKLYGKLLPSYPHLHTYIQIYLCMHPSSKFVFFFLKRIFLCVYKIFTFYNNLDFVIIKLAITIT